MTQREALREAVTDLVVDVRQWLEWHMHLGADEIGVEALEAPPRPRAAPAQAPARPAPAPSARPAPAPSERPAPPAARPTAPPPGPRPPRSGESLDAIRAELGDCTRCALSAGRRNLVYGVGNPNARLVIVGEAPGRDEDRIGEPFVGRAGQLLGRMLASIGLTRADVYICNVLKCRPPDNRDPEPHEVAACSPFVQRQIQAVGPAVILTVGRFASNVVCGLDLPMSALRLEVRSHAGIPVVPTWHPAYLLGNPRAKRTAWHDLLKARELLRA